MFGKVPVKVPAPPDQVELVALVVEPCSASGQLPGQATMSFPALAVGGAGAPITAVAGALTQPLASVTCTG